MRTVNFLLLFVRKVHFLEIRSRLKQHIYSVETFTQRFQAIIKQQNEQFQDYAYAQGIQNVS